MILYGSFWDFHFKCELVLALLGCFCFLTHRFTWIFIELVDIEQSSTTSICIDAFRRSFVLDGLEHKKHFGRQQSDGKRFSQRSHWPPFSDGYSWCVHCTHSNSECMPLMNWRQHIENIILSFPLNFSLSFIASTRVFESMHCWPSRSARRMLALVFAEQE